MGNTKNTAMTEARGAANNVYFDIRKYAHKDKPGSSTLLGAADAVQNLESGANILNAIPPVAYEIPKLGMLSFSAPVPLALTVLAASVVAALELLNRAAADVKTPYGGHRGARGGGRGPGQMREVYKEYEDRINALDDQPRDRLLYLRDQHDRLIEGWGALINLDRPRKVRQLYASANASKEALPETPSFLRDKFMAEQTVLDDLESSFPQPGQLPQDHIPLEMQATRDRNLEIYAPVTSAASEAQRNTSVPPRSIKNKLLGKFKSWRGSSATATPPAPPIPATGEGQIQGTLPASMPIPAPIPTHTPPLGAEVINPTEYLQNLRNSPPLQFTPQEPRSGVSPAIVAAMSMMPPMSASPAAGASPQNVTVNISNVATPPTRLADADFKRCLQREIDQIVWTFETGVRG